MVNVISHKDYFSFRKMEFSSNYLVFKPFNGGGSLLLAGANIIDVDSRKVSRNGYKPCILQTKHGDLELLKFQFCAFPFETQIFEKYIPS